jgi:hypothetical protein
VPYGAGSKQHAPGNLNPLSVDPAILGGEQRWDHWPDVIGHPGPTEGSHVSDHLVDSWIIANHSAAEIGSDGAWRDRVDGNSTSAKLFGQVTSQNFDCPLHRRIGGRFRNSNASKSAGEVDDAPAILDERQEFLRQNEDALEMDIEKVVEFLDRGLFKAFVERSAGIVDEVVESFCAQSCENR